MLANAAVVILGGLVALALSATPALFGGDLSPALLVISFLWGGFLALVAVSRHGSAAAVWRKLRRPPA
ncbi:MAG TPA: hypothetical protein VEU29_00915 [Actinomycetota bacterium]|nr:hypothetical protein [Actinomycetota bacterium]